uniref:NADH:ubiquinone reductase (non-electrogenic) n=1 Tax=viral metagenome TaxID=1070528 RepID=A0A6C0KYE0_9ZZZZ
MFEQRKNKPNVLVIGYGWGSSAFVQGLDTNKYNVKVISTRPQRLNQPRMINDLAPSYSPPPYRIPIIQDECLALEDTKNQVVCKTQSHTYDYLVIATGSEVNDFGIPGIKENCLMLKTEEDLEKLNSALKTPKPITIAGAGPTGLELAFRLNSPTQPVTVLEASPTILPGFSPEMQSAITNLLEKKQIKVLLNQKIVGIDQTCWKTATGPIPINGPAIWTCGIRPTQFTRQLNLQPDSKLQVRPNVYALGDCIRGHGPPTAQNAKQQGQYLATLFNKDFKYDDYKFVEKGRVIDVTDRLIVDINGRITEFPGILRALFYKFIE